MNDRKFFICFILMVAVIISIISLVYSISLDKYDNACIEGGFKKATDSSVIFGAGAVECDYNNIISVDSIETCKVSNKWNTCLSFKREYYKTNLNFKIR